MSAPAARRLPLFWSALLVAAVAWLGVAVLFHRVAPHDWTLPHWLEGDPLEVYARVKIAAEQPGHALTSFTRIDRLGAPWAADWNAYPVPDKIVFVLTGLLSVGVGLIAAVQLMSALIIALNAGSFFLAARWLRWRWEWAAALALVFAFGSYHVRWGITLSLSQTFCYPPLLLLCARAARRGRPLGAAWPWLGAALGAWLAVGNPYLAFFAGVVGGGALLLGLGRRSGWARLRPLVIFLGVLTTLFLATNAGYAWRHWHGAAGGDLARGAGDFTNYALRPIDWIVPPADHRLQFMARFGRDYLGARHGAGEFFYNYLGLAGLLGAALLLLGGLRSLTRKNRRMPDALLGLLWITAFGVAGGINTWLGAVGLDLFRAGTRIGVFALLWSLFCLGRGATRGTRAWPRALSAVVALALGFAACWEETPNLAALPGRDANARRWTAYENLTDALEAQLPRGAAVFQLPAVAFPEAGTTGRMTDYQHLLPLLTSHSLRFSYGQLKSSPTTRWMRSVGRRAPADLVAELERAGFAAVWIDTRAYADNGVALAAGILALGRPELPVPPDLPVRVFRLNPAASPVLPDVNDPRLLEPWTESTPAAGLPLVVAVEGWYGLEHAAGRRWRWAQERASAGIWWDSAAGDATLSFGLGGPRRNIVRLLVNDIKILRVDLPGGPAAPQRVTVRLTPGFTRLDWILDGHTFYPGGSDPRRLGFFIEDLTVTMP